MPIKRLAAAIALIWIAVTASPTLASAAELLAVMRASCPYCRAWDIEVGPIYPRTEESRIAPLHRIDIDRIDRAPYVFSEPVRYTPTFILLDRNVEIGRIVGYSNDGTFWASLHELLDKLQRGRRDMAREARRDF